MYTEAQWKQDKLNELKGFEVGYSIAINNYISLDLWLGMLNAEHSKEFRVSVDELDKEFIAGYLDFCKHGLLG
jgi:hypothetical protein